MKNKTIINLQKDVKYLDRWINILLVWLLILTSIVIGFITF